MHLADPTEAIRWPDIASTRVKRNTKHTSGRFHRSISLAWFCLNACQPLSAISIVFESHWRARMHFWKRLRIAALRKMQTPLSYFHCFRESWKGSHVLFKTISRSGIEENVNPSLLWSLFSRIIEGLACTCENDFAQRNWETRQPSQL